MAEQTHNTDMSDEPDRQDLEDRVDQLESTISKMLPSRRDALKLGGAALVGGAAMSGSASAGTQQAGTIGTSGSLVDVNAEDIDAVSVNTDKADITGEPVVKAARRNRVTGIPSGSYVNLVDTEKSDPLGIFNSSSQIVPTEDVPVQIIAQAQFENSARGDSVDFRIRDVDSNTDVEFENPFAALAASTDGIFLTLTGTLNANNAHEVQVRNADSTFSVGKFQSYFTLSKQIVHI
jgi:hypothetical protein